MIFKCLFSLSYALLQGLLLCSACSHADHIENNASPKDGRSGHGILVIGNTTEALPDIIVEKLNISVKTVENQIYIALEIMHIF